MNQHLENCEARMAKAIASFNDTLGLIRTGRANPQVLYGVNVDYYGAETPINQIASISVVEGRQLVIKPYDTNFLKNIERAIFEANLNLTPQNDGAVVRINVPALTEESRKALCKDVSKKAEEAKVAIRNIRRDINEAAKKDDSLTEDMEKDTLEKIQKQTDEAIKKIDGMAGDKAKEIMTV